MKMLLVGEDREGSLLQAVEAGLCEQWQVTVVDPATNLTRLVDAASLASRVRRRRGLRYASPSFVEAVEQNRPDVVLVIKGRGLAAAAIKRARAMCPVAIWYPDNPLWRTERSGDAMARLAASDLAIVWSERIGAALRDSCRSVATVPFGYAERWFPLCDPASPRKGIVFAGTWSRRRERFLRALTGLELTIVGTGWAQARDLPTGPPQRAEAAGELLRGAAIGVNILHPHNAGAHNMRTREIMASGALQLTDPGKDGTPFRDGVGSRWFRSPEQLRQLAEHYLAAPERALALAVEAQGLARHETYHHRSEQISSVLRTLL